jgi:hypothetical protein
MKTNYSTNLKKLFISGVFLLSSAMIFAQANFSGSWKLNESKSNFGDAPFRFAATSMVVTQEGNNLTVNSTQPGMDGGEMKTSAKYTLDGKTCENQGFMDMMRKSVVTWSEDKSSIKITSTINSDMGEMNFSEAWKLTENGKVLMVESAMPSMDGGEMKTTAAYDKQ